MLYARLADPQGLPESPSEALARWLRALGAPAGSIPAGHAERTRLWHSVIAGRRLAVITSHQVLDARPAAGFRQLRLRPLKRAAAIMLLARRLGPARTAGVMAVLKELARACGGFPLALCCAAHLTARSDNPVAELAVQLAMEEPRLVAQGFPRAEARISTVIEATSRQLAAATARAFRLLSLCPGPEVTAELAAAVPDTSPASARELLDEAAMAGLMEQAGHGWWQFHDLAHQQAHEQARRTGTERERRAATGRMLTWYTCAAISAHAVLAGSAGAQPATCTTPQDGSRNPPDRAAVWVDRHQPAMAAAVRAAAVRGDHAAAVRLAGVLWPLLGWHGCYLEELAIARLGVRAARARGDAPAEARMLAGVGSALRQLGRVAAEAGPLRSAARIWLEFCRDEQLAAPLCKLGRISAARGRQAGAIGYFAQALRLGQRGRQLPSPAEGP